MSQKQIYARGLARLPRAVSTWPGLLHTALDNPPQRAATEVSVGR